MKALFLLLIGLGCSLVLPAQSPGRERIERENYSEEISYDSQGRPLEIVLGRDGKTEETQSYSYDGNRIFISTEGRDGEGRNYSWQDILYLREDGSLRMMERKGTGPAPSLGWDSRSEWISHDDISEIIIYNEQGRVEKRVLFDGTNPVEEEHFRYNDGGELTFQILENYPLKERRETDYASGELISEQRLYRSDLLVSQTGFTYNEAGRIIEKITLGRGQTESWTALYDSRGRLSEEKFFKGGLLSRVVLYGEDEKTEEIYNKGRLSLKIHYRKGEIISEEKFD